MSGECDKCSEHAVECKCKKECNGALDALEEVGLLDEFEVFYEKQTRNINENLKEFAENHPDKLHVPQINEMYENICVWQRD